LYIDKKSFKINASLDKRWRGKIGKSTSVTERRAVGKVEVLSVWVFAMAMEREDIRVGQGGLGECGSMVNYDVVLGYG